MRFDSQVSFSDMVMISHEILVLVDELHGPHFPLLNSHFHDNKVVKMLLDHLVLFHKVSIQIMTTNNMRV
jgi:hypothetical protein